MAKLNLSTEKLVTPTINRPGIHAKAKSSNLKTSKQYKKAYRGQGRV